MIQTSEQLNSAIPKLKTRFNELVTIIIECQKANGSHRQNELSTKNHWLSEQLRNELNRVLTIDGSWEILEKCQAEALNRLNTFEKQQSKRKLN